MPPLDPALNQAILALVPVYEACPIAPATYPELMRADRLIVWDGASDATIFGDPTVNHAFRAWHDATHKALAADFSLAGERLTCEGQIAQLYWAFPRVPKLWATILRIEVIEQARHFARYGEFPIDQRAFTLGMMNHENIDQTA